MVANLQSVVLSSHWSEQHMLRRESLDDLSLSNAYLTGSPLARSWNPLHAKPLPWQFSYGRAIFLEISDGASELRFLTHALAWAKKSPAKFILGPRPGIASRVFNQQVRGLKVSSVFGNTFHALTHLDLNLAADNPDKRSFPMSEVITGVGSVLRSLCRLEYLRLNLPHEVLDEDRGRYTYGQIFGENVGHWPKLHTFIIHNLVIGTKDLTRLLTNSMSALRTLEIHSTMKLLDGQWDWIIAHLRQLNLSTFEIWSTSACQELACRESPWTDLGWYKSPFECPNGQYYLEERVHEEDQYCLYREGIPDYVLHGKRHPGLLPHQKDDESNLYLKELQKFLGTDSWD